jgi:TrmH family RNA methyltransferase
MPLSSGTIKFISSLRQRKFRQNYHKFTAEGGRIVDELLTQQHYVVEHVYALEEWVAARSKVSSVPVTTVTAKELGRISQLSTPNQVLAVVKLPNQPAELPVGINESWSLYLDGVQSPSNLGALLRIADWFGFHHVIAGPGTADLFNSKSIQATMGSFLRIDFRKGELGEVIDRFPGLPIFGADLDGEDIYQLQAPPSGVLVIGAEGPGVSKGARTQVQRWLTIPRAPDRAAESLNAAVAAGILCGGIRSRVIK